MTNEDKLAEEWLDERYLKDMGVRKPCKEAYLAGFKAGRETEKEYVRNNTFTSMKEQGLFPFGKWHKVADEDLPKHEVNVLVLYNVQCIDIAHYNYDYKEWHFRDSIVRDVIAWCELPKFEE